MKIREPIGIGPPWFDALTFMKEMRPGMLNCLINRLSLW